jgi:hypothetical protein
LRINEKAANEERRIKNEKKQADKNKLVVGVSKIDMMRSEPPSRVIVKKEKILDDSEIEMIKYLGLNLN